MIKFYSRNFFTARLIIYGITFALLLFMLFADPFEYICDGVNIICPGCGIKTGIYRLFHFDFAGAMESNAMSLLIFTLGIFAIADVLFGFRRKRIA